VSDIVERLRGFWGDVSNRDIIEAADEIERLRSRSETLEAALREIRDLEGEINTSNYDHDDACELNRQFCYAVNIADAALSPTSSPDVQLPKGWLTDEFSRVDADVAQWSVGMKDSFKEATGIAIPPAPTPSKGGDDAV
jgi:hypothetical protein